MKFTTEGSKFILVQVDVPDHYREISSKIIEIVAM